MLSNPVHLPEAERNQLAQLVTSIVKAISPEKIICFGSRINIMQDWSCFMPGDGLLQTSNAEYDLLIIPDNTDKRADHVVIQLCEQQAEPLGCRVTFIVHGLAAVNEAIEQGRRFFTTLYHKGFLLYNGSGLPLSGPATALTPAIIKSRMEAGWNKEFMMARRFYDSAVHCGSKGWQELCVFNLHQSVQHGCMALLRAITGYRSHTHNLSRLLALTENFSMHLISIFPLITEEEIQLFNLLRNAYSDARYNDSFTVTPEKAATLTQRVSRLLTVAEELYRKQLHLMTLKTVISFPVTVNNEPDEKQ